MIRSHQIPKRIIGICLLVASCILLGCEAEVSEECGGVGGVVSCLSIDGIQPSNVSGNPTTNVDAVASICTDGTTETFGDHNAEVTFSNTPFPGVDGTSLATADGSQRIVITGYSVTYTLNNCPAAATACPALTGFSIRGTTLTVPANGTVTGTFAFVPLSVKEEYVAEGGETSGTGSGAPYPSYSVNYMFSAQTEFFDDDITIQGSAEFTIGNFNLCGA